MIKNLSITILVDNHSPDNTRGTEHGLSFWIEADGFRLLFDTGQSNLMFDNGVLSGCDPAHADALVLSHGHYDHTGGVARLLELRQDLPIYCHPGVLIPRYSRRHEGSMKPVGISRPAAMELMRREQSIRWVNSSRYLADGIGCTGVLSRTTAFEDTGGDFFLDPLGKQSDLIEDDLSLWIETTDGVVVITGCCHSGIVNTLSCVRQITGCRSFHRIIGGLHLVNATEKRIDATIGYLRTEQWDSMVPCHCTGTVAVEALRREFSGRVEQGYAGMVIG